MPSTKAPTEKLICRVCNKPMKVGFTKKNAPYFVCANPDCLKSKPKYQPVKGAKTSPAGDVLQEPAKPAEKVTDGKKQTPSVVPKRVGLAGLGW